MSTPLSPLKAAWCYWLSTQSEYLQSVHDQRPAISRSAFEGGVEVERKRIRDLAVRANNGTQTWTRYEDEIAFMNGFAAGVMAANGETGRALLVIAEEWLAGGMRAQEQAEDLEGEEKSATVARAAVALSCANRLREKARQLGAEASHG